MSEVLQELFRSGFEVIRREDLERLMDKANQGAVESASNFRAATQAYGVATDGPVPPTSPLHELYVIQTLPDPLITSGPAKRALFDELFRTDMCYPWYDPLRILQFMWLIEIANRLPEGDFAEVGTAGGHGAHYIWRLMRSESHLYCFDTFDGFDPKEVAIENRLFDKAIPDDFIGVNPIEEVRRRITGGSEAANLSLVKGWFPGSFSGHELRRFRFAHVDLDLYEPTRATLEVIWPRIVPGGVMLFHDYGCSLFPGVRKAVDEFFAPLGITPFPLFDKLVSAAVIKQKAV